MAPTYQQAEQDQQTGLTMRNIFSIILSTVLSTTSFHQQSFVYVLCISSLSLINEGIINIYLFFRNCIPVYNSVNNYF